MDIFYLLKLLYLYLYLDLRVDSEEEQGGITITGLLGYVMKESVQIANDTYAKDNLYLQRAHLHVNVPEGATPKDVPRT